MMGFGNPHTDLKAKKKKERKRGKEEKKKKRKKKKLISCLRFQGNNK